MRTAALLLFAAACPALATARVEHRFAAAAPAGSVRRVVVEIPAGEVHVRNGAIGQLSVSGTVSRDPDGARSRDAEQRIVDDSSVAIAVKGEKATIRRAFGPNAQSWRAEKFSEWSVTVEVPAGMAVEVRTRYGVVKVEGTFGDIDVDLTAGAVDVRVPRTMVRRLRASCLAGQVRADLGDRVMKAEGLFAGKTRFENPSGSALLSLHTTFGEIDVALQ